MEEKNLSDGVKHNFYNFFEELCEEVRKEGHFVGERIIGSRKGFDLVIDIDITFKEFLFGGEKEISIQRQEECTFCKGSGAESTKKCLACDGKGKVKEIREAFYGPKTFSMACKECAGYGKIIEKKCSACKGSGTVTKNRIIRVHIPRNMKKGKTIILKCEGDCGYRGGDNGDIYLKIK